MTEKMIPPKGALTRTAEIDIANSAAAIFDYVSSSEKLPYWLKKTGPVNGAVNTLVNGGAYNFVGASRTVFFDDGSSIVEQLTDYQPYTYYSYSVTGITNKLRNLISIGYGQWWFAETGSLTHVKWAYSFLPKNLFARILLSLFLGLFYVRFMRHALRQVQGQLERHNTPATQPSI